jgi:ABC-2 type transport system ATP-binding protein
MIVVTKNSVIQIQNLSHSYGAKKIYENLNLSINRGSIYGVLGKNGVGKSTLINILMGYLQPKKGKCLIFGEDSHDLSPQNKERIALLHEGFVAYDYMSIEEVEKFFAPFYKKWDKRVFYELVDLMGLDYSQKLSTLSFGQKSQVVLGALFAQNAELLILDDYSMGLDAGYRRLFIDYLKDYIAKNEKTVLITSHVMSDLVGFIGEIAIVQRGGSVYQSSLEDFIKEFKCYEVPLEANFDESKVHRVQTYKDKKHLFSFEKLEGFEELSCDFEEKFLGFVGRY